MCPVSGFTHISLAKQVTWASPTLTNQENTLPLKVGCNWQEYMILLERRKRVNNCKQKQNLSHHLNDLPHTTLLRSLPFIQAWVQVPLCSPNTTWSSRSATHQYHTFGTQLMHIYNKVSYRLVCLVFPTRPLPS